jgi:hypothetical protein
LEAGDLVAISDDKPGSVVVKIGLRKAGEENPNVIGVISTKPGMVLGSDIVNGKPVALSGRVPVKVSTENGEIKTGDHITLSSLPGIGMKATTSGTMIGIALESFDGQKATTTEEVGGSRVSIGKIVVYVDLGYAKLTPQIKDGQITYSDKDIWTVDPTTGQIKSIATLDLNGFDIVNVKAIRSAAGKWSLDEEGRLSVSEINITDKINIGSSDKRIGITLFDETTGEPYCLRISGGMVKTNF